MSFRESTRKPRFPALFFDRGALLFGLVALGFLAVAGSIVVAWLLQHHRISMRLAALVLTGLWVGFGVYLRHTLKERVYLFGASRQPYFEVRPQGVLYRGELVASIDDVRQVRAVNRQGCIRPQLYLSLLLESPGKPGGRELFLRIYNYRWATRRQGLSNTVQLIWKMARNYGKPLPAGEVTSHDLS